MADQPRIDRDFWLQAVRDGFGRGFWGFVAFAVATGIACYLVLGSAAFAEALGHDLELLLSTLPRIVAALGVAGFVWALLPRERIIRLIGADSGLRGLIIATIGGAVTPGGPASAFSLLAVLSHGGAGRGALVAYITSWAMLGLQRILVWDVPFMGTDFSILRFSVCLPMPIVAGLLANRLPITLALPAEATKPELAE